MAPLSAKFVSVNHLRLPTSANRSLAVTFHQTGLPENHRLIRADKSAKDINSTVETVSFIARFVQVDFFDNNFGAWTVRAFAVDETGEAFHTRQGSI